MNIIKTTLVFAILFLFKVEFSFSQTTSGTERTIISNSRNAGVQLVNKDETNQTEISSEKTILNSSGRQARPVQLNEKTPLSNEKQNAEPQINTGRRVHNENMNEQKLQKANSVNPEK